MKRVLCFLLALSLALIPLNVSAQISAKSAVVIDGDTGEILYSLNCNQRMPMASTTKIMTALLLCEMGGDLSGKIVTTPEMVTVEGSSMGLLVGDTVSYHDLLYGMILASGNDAANTTAIALGGSVSGFVDLMNERATEMGLVDTHFVTPSGLDADEHYTTAYELAIIAKTALNNKHFAAAASSERATLCYGNPPYNRTLTNHNKLLKMYDDVVGVKTGFTKKSGRCLVSASKKDGKFVIAVTLNDGNDWSDHRELLDIGLSLVETRDFSPTKQSVSIPTAVGGVDDVRAIIPSVSINVTENSNVTYAVTLPRFLYATINKGEQIGSVTYYCNNSAVCTEKIVAQNSVNFKEDKTNSFFNIFKILLSSSGR